MSSRPTFDSLANAYEGLRSHPCRFIISPRTFHRHFSFSVSPLFFLLKSRLLVHAQSFRVFVHTPLKRPSERENSSRALINFISSARRSVKFPPFYSIRIPYLYFAPPIFPFNPFFHFFLSRISCSIRVDGRVNGSPLVKSSFCWCIIVYFVLFCYRKKITKRIYTHERRDKITPQFPLFCFLF